MYSKKGTVLPFGITSEMAKEYNLLIQQIFMVMKSNKSKIRDPWRLFQRTHDVSSNADDIFEEEFGAMLQALGFGENTVVGGKSVEIGTILDKELREKSMKAVDSAWKKRVSQNGTIKIAAGKVDIQTGQASYTLTDTGAIDEGNITKLTYLLSNATFSLKNYKTQRYFTEADGKVLRDTISNVRISLGHTKPTTILTAILSAAGIYQKDPGAVSRILWAYKQGKISKGSENYNHLNHITFLYELVGTGQRLNNLNNEVEFLIWNDPASDNISVVSIYTLLNRLLNEGFIGSPFGQKSLSIQDF